MLIVAFSKVPVLGRIAPAPGRPYTHLNIDAVVVGAFSIDLPPAVPDTCFHRPGRQTVRHTLPDLPVPDKIVADFTVSVEK